MLTTIRNYSKAFQLPVQASGSVAISQEIHSINAPLFTQWHKLVSALKTADNQQWVTLINPPFIPDDSFLERSGLANCYIRIVMLKEHNPNTLRYIQQSMHNGKSTLVAAWLNNEELAMEFQEETRSRCHTLLFCRDTVIGITEPQLEMAI
jgi:cell division inhibitor SulA